MWQRAQTLYLLISTILIGSMFFLPKAFEVDASGLQIRSYMFIKYLPYLILLIVISILNVIALTTFKVRVLQMRTALLAAIVTFAFQAWLVVDFYFTHEQVIFKLFALFPIAAVILDLLAFRGILADQLLVESAYHLRKSRRERRK